jgi:prepilin-type processing-associated H-X9-DG protein/prepilin-type N-terminal cleavage/methylation domain-containing protein
MRLRRAGFTLLELVVVIAIMGVLIGVTLAAVQRVRGAAARAKCQNNMRQIGFALHHYHDARGGLPPGLTSGASGNPYPYVSWLTRLLPYVEHGDLWRQTEDAYARDANFLDDPPHICLSTWVPLYTCPSDGRTQGFGETPTGKRVAFTSYLGMEGTNQFTADGVLYADSHVRFGEVLDGLSNTLMVGERPPSFDLRLGWWYAGWGQSQDGSAEMVLGVREKNYWNNGGSCAPGPYHYGPGRASNRCDVFHFWSPHPGGANFLFCDGSVRFLSYSADPIMPALATRAGGEHVTVPD